MGQKWGLCRRVKGGEVQKVHFLSPEGPPFWGPAPPKIDPGYGPAQGYSLVGLNEIRVRATLKTPFSCPPGRSPRSPIS